jgi:hypothetical protein
MTGNFRVVFSLISNFCHAHSLRPPSEGRYNKAVLASLARESKYPSER